MTDSQYDKLPDAAKKHIVKPGAAVDPTRGTVYDDYVFYYRGEKSALTAGEIPEGITILHEYCFADCARLRTVKLPASLRLIDEGAFYRCTSLENLDLPPGLKSIGANAFNQYQEKIRVPDLLDYCDPLAFGDIRTTTAALLRNPHYQVIDDCLINVAAKTFLFYLNPAAPKIAIPASVENFSQRLHLNPCFTELTAPVALIEKNPVLFWQSVRLYCSPCRTPLTVVSSYSEKAQNAYDRINADPWPGKWNGGQVHYKNVMQEKREVWLEQNKEAIESYNKTIAETGIISQQGVKAKEKQ